MSNNTYNITRQLVEENTSLWRIENEYLADAQTPEEKEFWKNLSQQKKEHIQKLEALLKKALA